MERLLYFCLILQIFVSNFYFHLGADTSWCDLKGSRVIIKRHDITFNPVISNLTFWHNCDGSNECVVNCVITSYFAIEKMKVYMTVKLPENEDDNEFRFQLLKTIIDVEKFFKGCKANPMVHFIVADFFRAIDFEPKLPLPPVRISKL